MIARNTKDKLTAWGPHTAVPWPVCDRKKLNKRTNGKMKRLQTTDQIRLKRQRVEKQYIERSITIRNAYRTALHSDLLMKREIKMLVQKMVLNGFTSNVV